MTNNIFGIDGVASLCHPSGVQYLWNALFQGCARTSLHPGLRYAVPSGLNAEVSCDVRHLLFNVRQWGSGIPARGEAHVDVTRSQALLGNAASEALLHNPAANTSVIRHDFQRCEIPSGSVPETFVPAERSSGDCIPKQSLGTRTNTHSLTVPLQRAARASLPLICADRCGSVGKYVFPFLLRELRDLRGKPIHHHPGATTTP
jgi:hypothetical protein